MEQNALKMKFLKRNKDSFNNREHLYISRGLLRLLTWGFVDFINVYDIRNIIYGMCNILNVLKNNENNI